MSLTHEHKYTFKCSPKITTATTTTPPSNQNKNRKKAKYTPRTVHLKIFIVIAKYTQTQCDPAIECVVDIL